MMTMMIVFDSFYFFLIMSCNSDVPFGEDGRYVVEDGAVDDGVVYVVDAGVVNADVV